MAVSTAVASNSSCLPASSSMLACPVSDDLCKPSATLSCLPLVLALSSSPCWPSLSWSEAERWISVQVRFCKAQCRTELLGAPCFPLLLGTYCHVNNRACSWAQAIGQVDISQRDILRWRFLQTRHMDWWPRVRGSTPDSLLFHWGPCNKLMQHFGSQKILLQSRGVSTWAQMVAKRLRWLRR